MIIWFVTIGEPLPHSKNSLRLHRTGLVSKIISESSNHNVVWWTSDFNHFTKEHINGEDSVLQPSPNLKIITLHGKGYSRNISINRIIDHKQISNKFRKKANQLPRPDIIISAFPTLDLCNECINLGKKWNIPVLIDYRDMWPEVFLDVTPDILKPLAKLFLTPLFYKTNKIFSKASGIIGITDEFLELALQKIKREENKYDAVFPLAYLKGQYSNDQLENAYRFWEEAIPRSNKLRISFLGTLGHQFDFETLIKGIEILHSRNIEDFEIILCGTGDKENILTEYSQKMPGLYLPGYISAAKIKALLETSDVGLCPYIINQAFLSSIPGKAIEYMSSGLPLLTTLRNGQLGKLSDENGFGYHYENGNPESFAEIVISLISKKNTLDHSKDAIQSVFKSKFDAETIYANYLKHIEYVYSNW